MARSDAMGMFWFDEPVVKVAKPPPPKRTPPERTWEQPGYLPGLLEARAFDVHVMNDAELWNAAQARERLRFDIECYENYFLIAFISEKTGWVWYAEMRPGEQLDINRVGWIMTNFTVVGFNSKNYDVPIASLALAGKTCSELKQATYDIIVAQERPQDVLKRHKVKRLECDHIDLMEVAPLFASLKIYAGRLHCKRMQDLPFHPDTWLSEDQITITRWYCVNDLSSTSLLDDALKEPLALRTAMSQQYNIDLRSRSDAQIAEHVLASEIHKTTGVRPTPPTIFPGTVYHYQVPSFLRFQSDLLNWALNIVRNTQFVVSEHGNIGMPEVLKGLELKMNQSTYRMGIGGLHSSEERRAHVSDSDCTLYDIDVESFYPRIMIVLGLYPKHLGMPFLREFIKIVDKRIHAKAMMKAAEAAGDKKEQAYWKVITESLKITINGSYGKLGSMFSVLYAPDLLIQVTLTGQLSLLMLIERLEYCGIPCVSANTDGVVIKCPNHMRAVMQAVVTQWQEDTGFKTEETQYDALYSKDVNNYIAVKAKGKGLKTKGVYGNPWAKKDYREMLSKNPVTTICMDAVEALLLHRKPLVETIFECKDITKFVAVRKVKGGAVQDGEYLGKSIRWYYSTEDRGEMVSADSGNKVPRSDGAKPCMTLPDEFPSDVDYDWYLNQSVRVLKEIAYYA